ncbi:tetratricopeptide repeat protein [Sphingobacterium bambusae]|uniref:Tetratricopeptide repeat protein n=1 Tax=Sphingobacterium bambusae TaxID=662858 RepID=A0ABW6BC44_9SPHI|nr:tetratricopeptide repeat protein [Sphingobacterium bambusae]WPL48796.1 tetratricopeptide repeat protein [Sphingobacterium bambusae]
MIKTILGLLALPFVTDVLKAATSLGYQKLKDINEFHKFLALYDIEKPKDEEKSLYIHTLLLFEVRFNQIALSNLLMREDSFLVFKNSYIQNKDKAPFVWHVNNAMVDRQDTILDEFFKIYDSLLRTVMTPVQSEMFNSFVDFKEQSNQQATVILAAIKALNDDSPLVKEQINFANAFIEGKQFTLALDALIILEKNFHVIKSVDHKSAILTNIGHCHFELGKKDEAHQYFKKAFDLNPENYAALCNYAQVLHNRNQCSEADKLIEKAVLSFGQQHSDIWEVYIIIKKGIHGLDEILKQIPGRFVEEPKVKRAIALVYRDQHDFDSYYKIIQEAFALSPEDDSIKVTYIESVLHRYQLDYRIYNLRSVNSDLIKEIDYLFGLIYDLLSSDKDVTESKLFLKQAEVTLLYLLRKESDALVILEELASEYPLEQQKFYRLKAMIHYSLMDFDGAIATLDKHFLLYGEMEDALMLTEITSQANRVDLLERYYQNLIEREGSVFVNQATNFLVDRYIKNQDIDKLIYWQTKIKEFDGLDFRIIEIRILIYLQSDDYLNLLSECESQVNDQTRFSLIYQLVELFEETKAYDKAIALLEKRVLTLDYDPITDHLLRLVEKNGDTFKLVELLSGLRENKGIHSKHSLMECNLYTLNYQFEKAISVAEQYLMVYPDRIDVRLFVITLHFKTQNYELLDQYLDFEFDYLALEKEDLQEYLTILAYRGRITKSIDILYENHRRQNSPQSNDLYLTFWFKFDVLSYLNIPTIVEEDTYVVLYDGANERINLLFENRPSYELIKSRSEVSTDDNLFVHLAGKEVSFEVTLESAFMKKKWIMESIVSKYKHQFDQCFANANGVFKREGSVKSFQIEELSNILNTIGLSRAEGKGTPFSIILDYYRAGEIGIGGISSILNDNPISIRHRIRVQGHKLLASHATVTDHNMLDKNKLRNGLVLDICGVFTLLELNLLDTVSSNLCTLTITPSTYEVIYDYLQQNIYNIKDGETLDSSPILIALRKYVCIENPDTLAVNNNDKIRVYKKHGRSFYDAVLLAHQKGSLLLSDDVAFRSQILNLCGEEIGCWIVPLLKHLKEHELIEDDTYHESLISLLELQYSFISVNEHTLLYCLKSEGYHVSNRFMELSKVLAGRVSTSESVIHTVFNFFDLLINLDNIDDQKNQDIALFSLSSVFAERTVDEVVDSYERIMKLYRGNAALFSFLKRLMLKFLELHNF